MKSIKNKNERLIPIESIIKKGKWDEYCRLVKISAALKNSVKKYPKQYKDVCLAVPEHIADKLGFIWKI